MVLLVILVNFWVLKNELNPYTDASSAFLLYLGLKELEF